MVPPINHCKRAPFPVRYSLQLLHLFLSSIRSTRDEPGAPVVALSKASDEASVAISVVIVWRVSMLSPRSPFRAPQISNSTTQCLQRFSPLQHLGKSELGIVGSQSPLALAEWAER
jgi:hypothetical protein